MSSRRNNSVLKRSLSEANIKTVFYIVVEQHIGFLLQFVPGPIGFLARWIFYKCLCKSLGRSVYIYPRTRISHSYGLEIGSNVTIEDGYIDARGKVRIGSNIMIAQDVMILSSTHSVERGSVPIIFRKQIFKPVVIEDDVWIGCRVVILPGVTIGKGSVVGAGSIVTKNIPSFTVAYGVPSKPQRKIE